MSTSSNNSRKGDQPTGWSDSEFSALVKDTFEEIWRYTWHRTFSEADADDLTANVLAIAWRRRDRMPGPSEARLWLFGVARNVLADHRRSARRQERLRAKLRLVVNQHHHDTVKIDDDLAKALTQLNPDDKEILLLRAWDGLAVTEMAEIFCCSPNAMSLRLHKARKKLASLLESQKEVTHPGNVRIDPKFNNLKR